MVVVVEFGVRLRQLRKGMGLTQVQIAERLHISKAMMSSYETGIRLPSYDVLIKVAVLFGVSTDYLLGFDRVKSVDVTGLSENQVDLLVEMVNEFRQI